jgi:hypothetical protein
MNAIFNFESTSDLINFIDHGSMQELLAIARSGWPEGLNIISDILQSLPLHINPEKFWKEFNPAITGMFFDVGLVCSGVPECWLQPQDAFNKGSFVSTDPDEERPIIKLGLNSTVPIGYPKAFSIERGAIIAVLAYLLEQSGRSVSITQYCSLSQKNNNFFGSVVLKRADEPLDIDLLAFWLVSPDSFKKCWLRVMENLPNSQVNGNYGFPICEYGENESDIFIKGISNKQNLWSRNDSVNWIIDNLTKLKISFII